MPVKKKPSKPLPTARMPMHPLLVGLSHPDHTLTSVADALGITPQSVFSWRSAARKDRNFRIPPEQVPALSKLFRIVPYYFNPDLWPSVTWTFEPKTTEAIQ